MSSTEFEDAGSVSVEGSALEPAAEPVTTEHQTESQAQEAEDGRYAERLAELEGPAPTQDWVQGYTQAAEELGYGVELEPGQPGYEEYALGEIERLQQERATLLGAAEQVVQTAWQQGNQDLLEYATNIRDQLYGQIEGAEYERQARAEAAAQEYQDTLEEFTHLVGEVVQDTTNLVGAEQDSIPMEHVAEIVADVYPELERQYGREGAVQLLPELFQKTVAEVSNNNERLVGELYEKAERLTKDLGNNAAPAEVVDLADSLYPRALYRAGGDSTEAARSSLLEAAKVAAGMTDKTQPLNASVASLYASLEKAVPRATPEPPKLEVKLDRARDPRTGQFVAKSLAETYTAKPPKSEAELRVDAQKQAIREAFSYLGGNAVNH